MIARISLVEIPPSPNLDFELPLWSSGAAYVAGVDEAGRGAWAGPVSAGAVILPPIPEIAARLPGVRDSKEMTPEQREAWAVEIRRLAIAWGTGFASNEEIDTIGIVPATCLAAMRALAQLPQSPQHLLIDYLRLANVDLPQTALVKGDARSLSIACASVLAKTARDALLVELDRKYPGYGFARHKGYGTRQHQAALRALGPTPIHRASFAPLRLLET